MVSAWSFGTSQRSNAQKTTTDSNPGPGSYTPYKYHNMRPSTWKIGTEQGRQNAYTKSKQPGPGAYDPAKTTYRHFPEFKFGLKTEYLGEQSLTPGPCQYQPKPETVLKEPPKYSFGFKAYGSQSSLKYSPGPAAYNIKRDLTRPSSRIGTQQRQDLYDSIKTPGVGTYNYTTEFVKTKGPAFRFGSEMRSSSASHLVSVPGPGAYNISPMINSLSGKTFGLKYQADLVTMREKKSKPGPGEYNPQISYTNPSAPGYRIGTESRGKLEREDLQKLAPNLYNPINIDKKRPQSCKVGTESRIKILNKETPGPGTYEIKQQIGDGYKFPFGLKYRIKDSQLTPGPADYQLNIKPIKNKHATHLIGTETRENANILNSDNPGPGTYEFKTESGQSAAFGYEKRGNYIQYITPGPGHYNVPAKFAEVPDYLIPASSKKKFFQ